MPLPYHQVGNYRIASFKAQDASVYGMFANTTRPYTQGFPQAVNINGRQETIQWQSSEQAFHGQKLIHAINKLAGMTHTNQESKQRAQEQIKILEGALHDLCSRNDKTFMPRDQWDNIRRNIVASGAKHKPPLFGKIEQYQGGALKVAELDALCDANYNAKFANKSGLMPPNARGEQIPYTRYFMQNVVEAKLRHNPEARTLAKRCAMEGIFPVEISRHDSTWASGPKGDGENLLGKTILELGNKFLQEDGQAHLIKIPDPDRTYDYEIRRSHMRDIAHDNLQDNLQEQPLKANYDNSYNRTIVEAPNGNLQIHVYADREPAVWFRSQRTNYQWTQGNLNEPYAKSIYEQYVQQYHQQQKQQLSQPQVKLTQHTQSTQAAPPTMTNTNFNIRPDHIRNHTVVETHRNANIQLHLNNDGGLKQIMYRDKPGGKWQEVKDINHPKAQSAKNLRDNYFKSVTNDMRSQMKSARSDHQKEQKDTQTYSVNRGPSR